MTSFVYLMVNPSMPGLVKFGKADNPQQRADQLSNWTGVPEPFEIVATRAVENAYAVETRLKRQHSELRANPNREFFRGEVEFFIHSLNSAEDAPLSATEQQLSIMDSQPSHKRPWPRFPMSDETNFGDRIQFFDHRNNENPNNGTWARIVGERELIIENNQNESGSENFSNATRRLAGESFRKGDKVTPFWRTAEGRSLFEIWRVWADGEDV